MIIFRLQVPAFNFLLRHLMHLLPQTSMDAGDQVVLTLTDDLPSKRKRFKHPGAVFFHLLFRVAALLTYLFCGWFSASFIASFVVVIVLLSMDFWTVKNVTGRLLVGLRWWNYVDESGHSQWIYEARQGEHINQLESRIFWFALVVAQVLWALLFIGSLFTLNLKWLMVVIVGFCMNGANLYGYVRCKIGAKKELSSVAKEFLGKQALSSMLASIRPSSSTVAGAGTGAANDMNERPDFPSEAKPRMKTEGN